MNTIEPLSKKFFDKAVGLAVGANTGTLEEVVDHFSLEDSENFVCLNEDKEVVGVIGWYLDDGFYAGKVLKELFPKSDGVFWINHFAVSESHRNKGIGTQLLLFLEQQLKNKQALELWVYTDMASRFYKKFGFEFVTRGFIDGEMCDFLRKKL